MGVGYWGRSNGLYCTDPKSSWQVSLKSLWVVGGGFDGVLRGLEEGWAGVSVHHPDYHMWISEGLAGDATSVMIYDMMWSDQTDGGRRAAVCCSTLNQGKGKLLREALVFSEAGGAVLGLLEQVICHGYVVKAGESLHHLTMNGAQRYGLLDHLCLLRTMSVGASAHY